MTQTASLIRGKHYGALALLALTPLLTGCSYFTSEGSSGSDTKLSTTGIGAATGAVVGSGVGALIGSQSGSAGGGLAIGAATGAAAGGAIGYALEKHDQQLNEQRSKAADQEQQIQQNRDQINELRRNLDDQMERNNRPSGASSRTTINNYRGSPRAKPVGAGEVARVESTSVEAPKAKTVTAAARVREEPAVESSAPVAASGALPPAKQKASAEKPAAKSLPPELNASGPVVVEEDREAPSETTSGGLPVALDEKKEIKKVPAAAAKAAPVTGECGKAEEEAKRARASVSESDKLFYLRRALRLCSNSAKYHVEIGKVYSSIGRLEDAQHEFKQALEIDPSNSEAKDELSVLSGGAGASR